MEQAEQESSVSEITRRHIVDTIGSVWSGKLDEVEFLKRLFDLDKMPSFDGRYSSASDDIWKHRIVNLDWPDQWVFTDSRFNILRGSDEAFLGFIAETVHPVVREPSEAEGLVEEFNRELSKDGWHLVELRRISGRAVFGAEKIGARVGVFEEPTGWPKVDRQVQEAQQLLREAQFEEQYQAVGHLCRELIISVAQAHYDSQRHPPQDGTTPSETDAARMIENFFAVDLAGGANEEARAHARASLKLAVALQHRRTADFRAAALCLEGTLSVVNIVAIIAGRRDR